MNDLEIKEFYRQMMVNMVFRYLEEKYFCYCPAGRDAILYQSVEEFKGFVRVKFNVVFLSCGYEKAGNYIRLEGFAEVTIHGKVFFVSAAKENLVDIREVHIDE